MPSPSHSTALLPIPCVRAWLRACRTTPLRAPSSRRWTAWASRRAPRPLTMACCASARTCSCPTWSTWRRPCADTRRSCAPPSHTPRLRVAYIQGRMGCMLQLDGLLEAAYEPMAAGLPSTCQQQDDAMGAGASAWQRPAIADSKGGEGARVCTRRGRAGTKVGERARIHMSVCSGACRFQQRARQRVVLAGGTPRRPAHIPFKDGRTCIRTARAGRPSQLHRTSKGSLTRTAVMPRGFGCAHRAILFCGAAWPASPMPTCAPAPTPFLLLSDSD